MGQKPSGVKRVLIVEDKPSNQAAIRALVEGFGFAAEIVADGKEAVEAVEKTSYALVLMDCQMPVMDGCAATREIRRREGQRGTHRVPIIAATAASTPVSRDECLAAGMDEYLTKPLDRGRLGAMLSAWTGVPLPVSGEEFGIEPELMEAYFDDCRTDIRRAEEDLGVLRLDGTAGKASAERLKRFGHQLAGSGGTYGYPCAGEKGKELEKLMNEVLSGDREADESCLQAAAAIIRGIRRHLGLQP